MNICYCCYEAYSRSTPFRGYLCFIPFNRFYPRLGNLFALRLAGEQWAKAKCRHAFLVQQHLAARQERNTGPLWARYSSKDISAKKSIIPIRKYTYIQIGSVRRICVHCRSMGWHVVPFFQGVGMGPFHPGWLAASLLSYDTSRSHSQIRRPQQLCQGTACMTCAEIIKNIYKLLKDHQIQTDIQQKLLFRFSAKVWHETQSVTIAGHVCRSKIIRFSNHWENRIETHPPLCHLYNRSF